MAMVKAGADRQVGAVRAETGKYSLNQQAGKQELVDMDVLYEPVDR